MNRESLITSLSVVVALIFVAAAAWVEPESRKAAIFSDQGETLFPSFRDVLAVKAIEVVDYNADEAVARPLKVEFRKGRWILPSHYDYPAEARDRLAKTAAAFLDLKKDIVVSDRSEDHARMGVIDPLDSRAASLSGRGKRITLRDGSGGVLVDLVLGEPVKERAGFRYVRLPHAKRVYAVKTEADPSARFEDWADPSILRLSPAQVRAITVLRYSVSESLGALTGSERTVLRRVSDSAWSMEGGSRPKPVTMNALLGALANLKLVGVRPKPPELSEQLRAKGPLQMTLESVMSLRQRGFFVSPDGRLLANEGETMVETENGILYNLRYGEIVTGQTDGDSGGAAATAAKVAAKPGGENRYLFLTASWDAARAAKYGQSEGKGEGLGNLLRAKFADWYYVISGDDFAKLRPTRESLEE